MDGKTDLVAPSKTWSLMDRIISVNGVPLVQSDVTSVQYVVSDTTDPTNVSVIDAESLTVSIVIFNTLQVLGWDTTDDPLGYNLRINWPLTLVPQVYSKIYQYVVTITLTDTSLLVITHSRQTIDEPVIEPYYGSPQGGDIYFSRKYGRDAWKCATDDDKIAVLTESTQHIENLNFFGTKTNPTQTLQFPRGGDSAIPTAIIYATYEESYQILIGRDVDQETSNRNIQQRKFGPVSTTYLLNARHPANVGAGILSTVAWRLLLPYLRRSEDLTLVRIS